MKTKTSALLAICLAACLSAAYWFASRSAPQAASAGQPATRGTPSQGTKPAANADASNMPRTKSAERPADASRTGKLDDDFNPANYQRRTMANAPGAPGSPAGAAIAYVQIPSSNIRAALPPNSHGEYESQPALTRETVGVRLRIEDVSPGTPVSVVILDGGSFPDSQEPSRIIKLGRDSEISFRFTTSANIGHHRIRVLPSGGTARLLDFTASES